MDINTNLSLKVVSIEFIRVEFDYETSQGQKIIVLKPANRLIFQAIVPKKK